MHGGGGTGDREGGEQQGEWGAEMTVSQWMPIFTRGTFYDE